MGVPMKLGVENIQKLGLAVCLIANASGRIYEDGVFNPIGDIPYLAEAIRGVSALISVNYPEAVREGIDLDSEEQKGLVEFLKEKLDLPQDKVESFIEKILDLAIRQAQIVCESIAMMRSMRFVA